MRVRRLVWLGMAEVKACRDTICIDLVIKAALRGGLELRQAERLAPHLVPTGMNGVVAHVVVEDNVLNPVGRLLSQCLIDIDQHVQQDGRIDRHEVPLGRAERKQADASTPNVVVEALQLVIVAHYDMWVQVLGMKILWLLEEMAMAGINFQKVSNQCDTTHM